MFMPYLLLVLLHVAVQSADKSFGVEVFHDNVATSRRHLGKPRLGPGLASGSLLDVVSNRLDTILNVRKLALAHERLSENIGIELAITAGQPALLDFSAVLFHVANGTLHTW